MRNCSSYDLPDRKKPSLARVSRRQLYHNVIIAHASILSCRSIPLPYVENHTFRSARQTVDRKTYDIRLNNLILLDLSLISPTINARGTSKVSIQEPALSR